MTSTSLSGVPGLLDRRQALALVGGVSYSGLAAASLYQINAVVPQLADGDYEVIASCSKFKRRFRLP
jgi:uncharacterized protein (TIGR03437 family)